MESSTICIALLLVLVAGLSTVWGGCDETKMGVCFANTQKAPADGGSKKATCDQMQAFLDCFEKNGKDCKADKVKPLQGVVKQYTDMMKSQKCPTAKKDDKKKDDKKKNKKKDDDKNGSSNMQVSSLILSISALFFVPAIVRM